MTMREPGHPCERGTSLVLVVLVLFAVFGLAALTIDISLVRLTQVQMQVAADGGALLGVSQRDALDDPLESDLSRRALARDAVSIVFDDDFDGDAALLADDSLQFGAGPVVNLTEGVTELRASRTVTLPASRVYDPRLELNLDNDRWGDIVAGTFDARGAAEESPLYERADFVASSAPEAPSATGLLLRLRRTRDTTGLDRLPGSSSSGPTLPLLFAHASLIRPTPESAFDARRDGLSVRATAIASTGRARRIGSARPDLGLPGRTPFSLTRAWWDSLPVDVPQTLAMDPEGILRDGAVAGGRASLGGLSVGEPIVPISALDPSASELAYAPITIESGGVARVAGFGPVRFVSLDGVTFEVSRLPGRVAPANASAAGFEGVASLSPATRAAVESAHALITDPLQAGRIVR